MNHIGIKKPVGLVCGPQTCRFCFKPGMVLVDLVTIVSKVAVTQIEHIETHQPMTTERAVHCAL